MTNIKERFESKIYYSIDGCWYWTGSLSVAPTHRYGVFFYKQKRTLAHRMSFELYKSKPPKDMCVCHSCDNPACVNPDHLFLGTHQDNMHDMARKKRVYHHGTDNPNAKLTESDVIQIRTIHKDKKVREIKKMYDISYSHAYKIQRGGGWAFLSDKK